MIDACVPIPPEEGDIYYGDNGDDDDDDDARGRRKRGPTEETEWIGGSKTTISSAISGASHEKPQTSVSGWTDEEQSPVTHVDLRLDYASSQRSCLILFRP